MKLLTTSFYMLLTTLVAQAAPVLTSGNNKLAISGYDPVAYFTENAALEGSADYSLVHKGVTYQFTSEKHLKLFQNSPDTYLPAYGGYCAYGVSKGGLYKINPKSWSVIDGALYLNYDSGVQRKWSKRSELYIDRANEKWPELAENESKK